MAAVQISPGTAFVIEDEDGENEHLHVVITERSLEGEVVTVSVSTRQRWSEPLVVLKEGCHSWVTRESVVAYRFADIRTCVAISEALAKVAARAREDFSPELLKRLRDGLLDSDFTPPTVRAYYKALQNTAKPMATPLASSPVSPSKIDLSK